MGYEGGRQSDNMPSITKKGAVFLEWIKCKAGAKKWGRKECQANYNSLKKQGCDKKYAAVIECTGAKKKPPP